MCVMIMINAPARKLSIERNLSHSFIIKHATDINQAPKRTWLSVQNKWKRQLEYSRPRLQIIHQKRVVSFACY
jgi:hypothetical protein